MWLLFSILLKQEDREAEVCRRDNTLPSLLHVPLGLLAALQNSARGHSGNHLFPAEHRARGTQEARLTNLRGKMVVCQCACCEITTPHPLCGVIHPTGKMKCCRTDYNTNLITQHEERALNFDLIYHNDNNEKLVVAQFTVLLPVFSPHIDS